MSSVVEAPKKSSIAELLGKDAENLLTYKAKVPASRLHLPGADYVDRVWTASDRPRAFRASLCIPGSSSPSKHRSPRR